MPSFRAAYLIHGDDHGRIAERRARLRAVAETESGSAGVEVYEGDACTPAAVVGALSTMTFALGRRFVIADGVERWKDSEVHSVAEALATADPETLTVAFFGRDESRYKTSQLLSDAVERAGGVIAVEQGVKPWELPKWVAEQARALDLELESGAPKALVEQVGERQQRLVRELEKLALEHGPGAHITAEDVEASCASSAERKLFTLADALAVGDARRSLRLLLELRQQGERVPGLVYKMSDRLRQAVAVAEALAAGQSKAQVKRLVRGSPKSVETFISGVSKRDVEALRRALAAVADLEVETRGGAGGVLSEDTAAVRAVLAAAF